MKKITILIFVLAIISCGKTSDTNITKKNDVNKTDTVQSNKTEPNDDRKDVKPGNSEADYTVLETGENMEWLFGKGYSEWIPDNEVIDYTLKKIDTCFYDQSRGTANRLLNMKPNDYCMQFVGAINSKGEKLLWVNSFCKKQKNNFMDWKEKLVSVEDGGKCFYNVLFNLTNKNEPYKLLVNGNA